MQRCLSGKRRLKTPLIVSCLFGTGPFDIYRPPDPALYRCVFFTNREEIAQRAQSQGWTPCMMPLPEETDPMATALQSKAVKFLSFLEDPFYAPHGWDVKDGVVYFDHKFRVTGDHIAKLVSGAGEAAVVLRSTPMLKTSVWTEVEAAEHQERYARHMMQTRQYIDRLLANGHSAETRICNTGLIYYSDPKVALPLAQSVLKSCLLLRQPECQIFWALHAQPYSHTIKVIDWKDPAVADIEWCDPGLLTRAEARVTKFVGPNKQVNTAHISCGRQNVAIVKSKFGDIVGYANDLITSQIADFGNHTRPEFAFAAGLINHDSKVFDLGAHIGTFSLEALAKMGGEGKLLAVEGNPTTFEFLQMNVQQQPKRAQTFLQNAFIGGGAGFEYISVEHNTGAGHLRPAAHGKVAAHSLDDFVRTHFEPDYIKIDIEGAEYAVLSNSSYIVQRRPVLYLEVAVEQLARFGHGKQQVDDFLRNLNYRLFVNVGDRNARHDYFKPAEIPDLISYSDFFDVLCVPADAPACSALVAAAELR
jgi:FkbM family methyltransferase